MANQENQKIIPWQIGQIFYRYRKKLGWTQEQVANILGIERSAYSYYESGKTVPDLSTLILLSQIFNLNIHDFINFIISDSPDFFSFSMEQKKKPAFPNEKNPTKDETQLICYFRVLEPSRQAALLESAKKLAEANHPKK